MKLNRYLTPYNIKELKRLLLDHVALSYSKSYINNINGVLGINIYKKKLPY